MINDQLRTEIFHRLILADSRSCFFSRTCSKLTKKERRLNIWICVLSSGAFLLLIPQGSPRWITAVLNLSVATLAIYLAFAGLGAKAALASQLFTKWKELERDYERLWMKQDRFEQEEALQEWERLTAIEVRLSADAPSKFEEDEGLMLKCMSEAEQRRI